MWVPVDLFEIISAEETFLRVKKSNNVISETLAPCDLKTKMEITKILTRNKQMLKRNKRILKGNEKMFKGN